MSNSLTPEEVRKLRQTVRPSNVDSYRQYLNISPDHANKLLNHLFVADLSDIICGRMARWFPSNEPTKLMTGIICDVRVMEMGLAIVYKNIGGRTMYQFVMDDHMIFQKLSAQEIVVVRALEHP